MSKYDVHDILELRRTMLLFDDFQEYASGVSNGCGWTTVTAGAGAATVGDTVGGVLNLAPTDSTTNREVYVKGSHQLFLFANNKPFCGEAYIQFTEANTNKANIAFGFMSGVGAASMADTTGEPKASFSGAVIYKVPGGTVWKTASSVGTVMGGAGGVAQVSDATAGGAAYVRLRIEVMPISTTIAEVTYFVDGIQLKTSGGRPGQALIKDQLTYTSALQMSVFMMCKNGSTTAETLNVDYVGCEHLRALFTGF
jgi:hypothetical protein